jgi:hexulose-6-phosphate isomerase
MASKVGFMQGRLSPVINGKIQEFPWENWRREFEDASCLGFGLMEWTLDQDRLYESPLMSQAGQLEITQLCQEYGIEIPSLTGDCFMQSPFWKLTGEERKNRQDDFCQILDSCAAIGIKQIIIPLVDNGRISDGEHSKNLLKFLNAQRENISNKGISISFESDFSPSALKDFISLFDREIFGINYDIGNSAALGYNVEDEFAAYGDRILNVHVKDRVLGGNTVPVGKGDADFVKVFQCLTQIEYQGNYILQTARADDGDHSGALRNYKSMVEQWVVDSEF